MKKNLSLILVLVLILSMCFQVTVNAADNALMPLPEVGEVVSGFKTIELGNMELTNSKTVLFEHEKTGAKLLYIQNKDIDRAFDIAFKTPAVDDTGANHILEHISVSGSEKYPMKNLLFTVLNQTYSTFINAFTAQNFTSYPVSSMSEAQLLKLTDVYLDCVFHPSVYNEKNVFSREAWRYEMADANAPLTINGTVYNEMKGALGNITQAARNNVLDVLYPDSIEANISGGDPDKIKDLTYEQLIKTHSTYYHPSNSLMVLYGNLDYKEFLKLINDNYLSKYDKKEIKVENGRITPLKQKTEKTFKFPVAATSNTKNAAQIDYAYALTNVSDEDIMGLSVLVEVLNQETSPLKKAYNEKQIGGSVTVSFDNSLTQPVLTFTTQNADENKKTDFKTLVDSSMSNILKTGFDKEVLDAMISMFLFSSSNTTEIANLGVNLAMSINLSWANNNNTNYLNNMIQDIKNIRNKLKNNYFENLLVKYIQNNNHAALVTTIPEAGLAEKQSDQQKKYLSDLKASMSKDDIEKIVSGTKTYNEWNNKEQDQNIVKELQAVKVTDLPEEVKKYVIKDKVAPDGVRILSVEANVGETVSTSLIIDASAVPADKLHYLQLYSSLLGSLDTKAHTKEQLNILATRYLNGASYSLSTIQQKDSKQFAPILTVSWAGLIGEYDKGLEIVKEVLLNTKFENSNDILNKVKSQIVNLKNSFTNSPLNILMSRNTASFEDNANYMNYISGLDYYNFLIKLEQTLKSDQITAVTELNGIKQLVLNKTNMITAFSGNKNNIKKYEDSIKVITDAMPKNAIVKQDYSKLPRPDQKEGIAIDTTVQYNMISASYEKMGVQYSGKFIPIAALINENYTSPKIRFGNGAYGNIESFTSNGLFLVSYRDPNIKETFDIFKGLPDYLQNLNITQEDLDRFILKSYSEYSAPSGELAGASNTLNNYLSGRTTEDKLKVLSEIKSLKVKDVKDAAVMLDNFIKNGAYSTVGSLEKLTDNKQLYNIIISTDSQKKNETITRVQFLDIVFAGAPNTLSTAKQYGLILGDGKGKLYENNKLTKQELATFIYRIVKLNNIKLDGKDIEITDLNLASSWANEGIKALVNSGIIKLDDKGKFNPKEEISASYVQTLLAELSKKVPQK